MTHFPNVSIFLIKKLIGLLKAIVFRNLNLNSCVLSSFKEHKSIVIPDKQKPFKIAEN
jgi:hypothetical protein